MRPVALGLLVAIASLPAAAAQEEARPTSCVACHGSPDWFDEEAIAIVESTADGIHAEADLSCHDCHGGDPDPALAEDMDSAMDPEYEPNPYRGVPAKSEIPAFCGDCHSDPTYMRTFSPRIRVDQEQEYRTSHHGESLREGNEKVAACVDCHGVHGILGVGNPEAPVYPTNVAETCRSCHGDPELMAGVTTEDGDPLPVDQYVAWSRSVHAAALLEKGDLSAPTCNDCHGNHGATPPGVESVAYVCGQCHGREAELFRGSEKRDGFEEHNEYLAGAESCLDCHDESQPQAAITELDHFSECASCHGNHAVVSPRITLLAPLPKTPCALCHESGGALTEIEEAEETARSYAETRDALLDELEAEGLEGDALFDELVRRAERLSTHTRPSEEEGVELRPEFRILFEKFRIGTTSFEYPSPTGGDPVEIGVRGCDECHSPEPMMTDEAVGYRTGETMVSRIRELTGLSARAERLLLRARRGGVQTRDAQEAIDQALDAQIELQVLVHTFDAGEGSDFLEKHEEGVEHARNALEASRAALDELRFRRQGLAASLIVILILIVALAAKIRQVSDDDGG